MIVNTKYDVGYTFWVPRVRKQMFTEELCFEGETWSREVTKYVPYVKKKEIVSITARVNCYSNVRVLYSIIDYKETHQLSQTYTEDALTNYTEEEALSIAEEYAESNIEYFGN
jgi:hypothetical protein